MKNDPRVTRIGRFIRKYSIDELPQLINVLRQEMSVVGPAPAVAGPRSKYEAGSAAAPVGSARLTGIWQVSGRSDLPSDKTVRLDLSYVDNWSMVGDILIIAKTLRAVLERRGAY